MGMFKNKEEALRMADHLIEATRPETERIIAQARSERESTPTTTHDSGTNSTTVINGDHQGITGGVHYGDLHFGR
ncbi:hypothetical protein PV726_48015 [Streptomyces europaeiscabiei]|uniref:hypothetical protein n=1 Tax=Streptomyces europaeiscabiei TaxID=146819 RepID=UPI0029A26BC4|nr:hypothetical protein [Streptomyces europaeiscabiei]MDX3697780.1 hypothetical protein [Streptomyces europaeiscabiei]